MANEKVLNTRIQLKYDTLANWNASSFKLKAGELAIVTLGETKDGTTAGAVNQHPVLFKVGTGNHTFKELPYASALAADVYAWAKASDVVLAGKTIQFKNGDTVVKSIELNYITETEANTLITNALKSYSTTEQMNAAIAVETDRADKAEKALGARIDAIVSGDNSVDSKITAAIAGLDSTASQAAGNDGLALNITEVDGKITAISGSIATNTYDAHGAAAAAKSEAIADAEGKINTLKNTEVKANTDAIAAIKNHDTVDSFSDVMTEMAKYQLAGDYATKAEAQGYADAKDAAIKAAKDAADAAQADIDAFMAAAETGDAALDTLKEIQDFLNSDDGTVQKLIDDVADNKSAIEDIVDGTTTVAKATNADKAADADKLGGSVAADYLKKADATGYADILTKTEAAGTYQPKGNYATAAQGALADTAVQPAALNDYYTKTAADAEFMNSTETDSAIDTKITALKLGETYEPIGAEGRAKAYADGLAGNYATAAQGAKADTALQEITTTANNGLKVTGKNQIDIDTNVVFVFDCGSATKNID